jgi:hypothetical protein
LRVLVATSDSVTTSENLSFLGEDNDSIAENVAVAESLQVELKLLSELRFTDNITVTESVSAQVVYPPLEINKTESITIAEDLRMKRTKHKQPKIHDIQIDQDETAVYLGQDNDSNIYLGQN